MGKLRTIDLTPADRQALEFAFRTGSSHAIRQRCQIVLLKSEGRSSKEVEGIVKQHYVSVNAWLTRYEQAGLDGLLTKPGPERTPLLDKQTDAVLVRKIVQNERQRLSQAKAQLEAQTGRTMSLKTLQRFLKYLTATTDANRPWSYSTMPAFIRLTKSANALGIGKNGVYTSSICRPTVRI